MTEHKQKQLNEKQLNKLVKDAVKRGATVIEKHYTMNNNQIGPDHFFSMNPFMTMYLPFRCLLPQLISSYSISPSNIRWFYSTFSFIKIIPNAYF